MSRFQANSSSGTFRSITMILATCTVFVTAGIAPCSTPALGGDLTSLSQSVYDFIPTESTITQSGGFAGVNWTYTLEGRFQLLIDPNAGTAVFTTVDANAVRTDDPSQTLDPSEVFNLTGLTGMLTLSGAYVFRGHVADGSSVVITLAFDGDSASLIAQTTPPPNTADFFIFSLDAAATRKYGGGNGTAEQPYKIWTAGQLQAVGAEPDDWNRHFRLMTDVDMADMTNEGPVIGYSFTGVFDGNNHTISHLTRPLFDSIGFAGVQSGIVLNLGLIDPNIKEASVAGSLVQYLGGTVYNCYVAGGVVSAGDIGGGLVGIAALQGAIVADCYADTTVHADYAGGLVGMLAGGGGNAIVRCHAAGTVTGHTAVGGLVGYNVGTIKDSYSSASVAGDSAVGGLVGDNIRVGGRGKVVNCYSTGSVDGGAAGGLVGHNTGVVANSFWDIETSGLVASDGGTGMTTAEMQSAATFLGAGWDFADETANGTGDYWQLDEDYDYPQLVSRRNVPFRYAGGWGRPDDPYLIYTAEQLNSIGRDPNDSFCHFKLMADIDLGQYQGSEFNIIGTGEFYPDWPFMGAFDGAGHVISNFTCSRDGGESVGLFGRVGSFLILGAGNPRIENLGLVNPDVSVENGSCVGPLVGYLATGVVASCYVAGGSVAGDSYVGGLVGGNLGTVSQCYSTCAVSGREGSGGLVGWSRSTVATCYSAGPVTGRSNVGGFLGYKNGGEVIACFWDTLASGQTASAAGEGRTTAEMRTAATFLEAGWDFLGETDNGTEDIWWIDEGLDYPRLWWELVGW